MAGVSGNLNDVSGLNNGNPAVCYYDSLGVVHPNGIAASAGQAVIRRSAKDTPLKLAVSLYCENMRTKTDEVDVKPSATPTYHRIEPTRRLLLQSCRCWRAPGLR